MLFYLKPGMKKFVKWVGIAFLIVIGLGVIVELTQSPEPKATIAAKLEQEKPSITNKPPFTMIVTAAANEKKFFSDAICLDEAECYGSKSFMKDIFIEYPDLKTRIQTVKKTNKISDADFNDQREAIVIGMYFAKKINLANGQSLFDFLNLCSGSWDINNRAEFDFDSKQNQSYFYLQYFPKLRLSFDSQPIDLNLIFDRRGDTIVPNSMAFSTHVLNSKDFLSKHGLKCWNE